MWRDSDVMFVLNRSRDTHDWLIAGDEQRSGARFASLILARQYTSTTPNWSCYFKQRNNQPAPEAHVRGGSRIFQMGGLNYYFGRFPGMHDIETKLDPGCVLSAPFDPPMHVGGVLHKNMADFFDGEVLIVK